MSLLSQLSHFLSQPWLDVIQFVLLAITACYLARRVLTRWRVTQDFGAPMWGCVALVAITGIFAAGKVDWLGSVAVSRSFVFTAAALFILGLLSTASYIAALRFRIRQHAEIERELHTAKIAADQAMQAKSDFLSVMHHEIRTPLNAVMGFASLLAESKLDNDQRSCVTTITSEGLRLGSLVNDLLDLTEIEGGRLLLERVPFAPAETAHEVLRLLNGRAVEKKLDLRFEAQIVGPLFVSGDPMRFRQILVNLVDNAIKFTPCGSITVFLGWTPPAPGATQGNLSVRVRDSGIGIPAGKLADLFQKFMQADTSMTRRYGGAGLGLSLCQRLAAMMGGTIAAESTPGVGSEFTFTIPMATVAVPAKSVPAAPEPVVRRDKVPRILVVDDMETNRFLLEVFLRRNGFEPELAAGGDEAVRLTGQNRYDAILMDLQMPDVDGYTATRRIRASEASGQRTPIIALTASISTGTREKCFNAGMDEHLTKPLDLLKFKTYLNSVLAPVAA